MNRFFGLDLGDAESAVSRLEKGSLDQPVIIPVAGARSFITAYASLTTGEIQVGERACYSENAIKKICSKEHIRFSKARPRLRDFGFCDRSTMPQIENEMKIARLNHFRKARYGRSHRTY